MARNEVRVTTSPISQNQHWVGFESIWELGSTIPCYSLAEIQHGVLLIGPWRGEKQASEKNTENVKKHTVQQHDINKQHRCRHTKCILVAWKTNSLGEAGRIPSVFSEGDQIFSMETCLIHPVKNFKLSEHNTHCRSRRRRARQGAII